MASENLGSVLVVGGCGFLGYEIVSMLVKVPCCQISVLSRNPRQPYITGVSYHACDIADVDSLRPLILSIQPQIIIHTASPLFYDDEIDKNLLHQVNVVGTQNLLALATSTSSVKAFIYTSTSSVHAGADFKFIAESAPVLDRSSRSNEYGITKAIADTMVLGANCKELQTLCLRPPVIYGERDSQLIPGVLALLRDKKTNIQLGDNNNLYDAIYVGNAASAHIAAAKALSDPVTTKSKIDGEAFFITDDNPIPFWDFQRKIWTAAGDKTPAASIHVIPAWVVMTMAAIVEYLFWIGSLGQKLPPKTLRRDVLRYTIHNRTFCIDKAKERLGYEPLVSTDEGIKRGVEWMLQNQAAPK